MPSVSFTGGAFDFLRGGCDCGAELNCRRRSGRAGPLFDVEVSLDAEVDCESVAVVIGASVFCGGCDVRLPLEDG